MKLTIRILDHTGAPLAEANGEDAICLVYRSAYCEGDVIEILADRADAFVALRLGNAAPPATVFLKASPFCFPVPLGGAGAAWPPGAFCGALHRLTVRASRPHELTARRNLAFNPFDHHGNSNAFPHVCATAETRGEAAFAARNTIDGEIANDAHGFWPYTSWGINRDPDAALTLEFGRPVVLDEIGLTLRADFPHDAWWRCARLSFADGQVQEVRLEKTGAAQYFAISPVCTDRLTLDRLIKADDPSPFPALTQIEAWGREC